MQKEREKRIADNLKAVIPKEYDNKDLQNLVLPADISKTVFKWLYNPSPMLILMGPTGRGKTTLMAAIYKFLIHDYFEVMKWATHHEISQKFKSYISNNQDSSYYRSDLLDYKYLFIDDFGNVNYNTDWQKDLVTQLVHDRGLNEDKPTIISTNLTITEIRYKYEDRVDSRLFRNRNVVIDFSELPDYRKTYEASNQAS